MSGTYYYGKETGRQPIDIDDMVKNIVMNVTGKYKKEPEVKPESIPPRAAPIGSTGAPPSSSSSAEGPPRNQPCTHTSKWHLYFRPCFVCPQLCNCASYFPDEYPDVLVRSVDKKITRLSRNLVRASEILRSLVDEALKGQKEGRATGSEVKEEIVAIKTEYNDSYSIMDFQTLNEGEDTDYFATPTKPARPAQVLKEAVHKSNGDTWEDLMGTSMDSVLALFDPDTDVPTFGICREVLRKLDYYVCTHLDEVDQRVKNKQKKEEYFENSSLVKNGYVCYLDIAPDMLNTFAYEDWEEEFFNVDTVQFFDLYQANSELLIWDLYYALEKWMFLGRGFPRRMVNGQYDFLNDPDPDLADIRDKRNVFGAFNIRYNNPRRTRRNYRPKEKSPFFHPGMPARWWSIRSNGSAAMTTIDNEEIFQRK